MQPLDALLKYFPTGTTEGELAILKEVFITPQQLQDVLAIPKGSPRVIVAPKGTGKSAVIHRLEKAAKDRKIPALVLRPDDLDLSDLGSARDIATIKRVAYRCLVSAVAVNIGKSVTGMVGGDAATLRKEALELGKTDPDFVERVHKLLSNIAKPVTKVDFTQIAKDLSPRRDRSDLVKSIEGFLSDSSRLSFLLLDDTDQVAAPEEADHLNRIWGLALAVRKLAAESPSTRCLITLRSEIWNRMMRNKRGQRDQIDHIRPLVVDLHTTEAHQGAILDRRIHLARKACGRGPRDGFKPFFEGDRFKLPDSSETRAWSTFLLKSSRNRPRDLIQLVGAIASSARRHGRDRIGGEDVEYALHKYSRERAEYLANEVGPDCESFLDLLRTFAGLPWEMEFEVIRRHLEVLPSRFGLSLRGRMIHPGEDAVIPLLQLLFESGFISARVADPSQDKGFRHVSYADEPYYVTRERWNILQSVTWEIHPAFRTYLRDEGANTGRRAAIVAQAKEK